MPAESNFEFLGKYDPLLAQYGLQAELYVYSDPNASIIKSRQLGEHLAKHTAQHAGLDPEDLSFDRTVGMLKRQRLIRFDVAEWFTHLRLAGNAAVHEDENDSNMALQSVVCVYNLASWFNKNVLDKSDFDPGPFTPLFDPEDATDELKEEIDFLRKEKARSALNQSATDAEIKELTQKLEQEASQYNRALQQDRFQRDYDLKIMEQKSEQRLRQLTPVATSEAFQRLVARCQESALRTGDRDNSTLALNQLRIKTGRISGCCHKPMVVVQSMAGGFIKQNCPECNSSETSETLSQNEFMKLGIYVSCAKCRRQAEPKLLHKNYGYECSRCGWRCELAQLVPHYLDMQPLDN